MGATKLGSGARLYVCALAVAGVSAGAHFVLSGNPASWDWRAVAFLGLLAVAGPALSVSNQGYLPSRIVHQIGSAFAYALFFLEPPGAVCVILWAMTVADWLLNRRRPLQFVFNAGQLGVALFVAVETRSFLLPGFTVLADLNARTLSAALASLVAFSVVNQVLTHCVLALSSGRPLHRVRSLTGPAFLVEVLCIVAGLGMAVLWQVDPWLMLLGVIPIWVLMLLLTQLSHREQQLQSRQEDLRALQGLGLELGSELDADRLRHAVVRIATQALQARGAVLLALDRTRSHLLVQAHEGIDTPLPETLRAHRFDEEFLRSSEVVAVSDFRAERSAYPELDFLDANGILFSPIEVLGRREGLLLLFHGRERRPFNDDDTRRLDILVRFIRVALSNAELVRDLRVMQDELAQTEKMSALGMLVSGVAHEINNPLTSILGYAQLLLSQENDVERRRMLDRIVAEAERAGKIVHNLLTFSRKRRPEKTLTDLNQVLEQVLELREYDLRLHDVRLVKRLSRNLPPVLVDGHQMQQVLLNLLANAEDALRERRRRGRIVVETRDMGGRVQLLVSDDGPGIAAENLNKIFLPFFTTKGIGRGTGLGLAICYGIIQEHDGRIDVESRENEGASFIVELPTARVQVEPGSLEPVVQVAPPPKTPGGRVLVVDDDEAISDLVREALEIEGWTVTAARDGAEALDIVSDADFDVLLVDLRMPGMDGRSFYEALRNVRPELERRVIFATGDTGSEDTARFLEESGKKVLGKPYELRDLIEIVSRIAGGSSQVH